MTMSLRDELKLDDYHQKNLPKIGWIQQDIHNQHEREHYIT